MPFPNIFWWQQVLESSTIVFDIFENYEKMTFRNRYSIMTANGVLNMSIPLKQGRSQRKVMKDIEIDNKANWDIQHWRSLLTAYNRAPFFEFYANDLQNLFNKKHKFLLDFNIDSIRFLIDKFKTEKPITFTDLYMSTLNYSEEIDLRKSFKCNQYLQVSTVFKPYYQVFKNKFSFAPNLSALDLLFSEGPNSVAYLK